MGRRGQQSAQHGRDASAGDSRGVDGYRSLRNGKYSNKSAGRSGGGDSRSPGGTGTYGRGEQPLDDPDYSLSVSDLNSNMANSLLKSATRGAGRTGGAPLDGLSPDSSLAPRF